MNNAKTLYLPIALLIILSLATTFQILSGASNLITWTAIGVQRIDDENITISNLDRLSSISTSTQAGKNLPQVQIKVDAQRAIATDEATHESIEEEEIVNIEAENVWQLFEVDLVTQKKVIKSGESKEMMTRLLESTGTINGNLEINKDYIDEEERNKVAFTIKANLNGKEFVLGPVIKKGQDLIAAESGAGPVTLATFAEGPHHIKIYMTSGLHNGSLFVFCNDLVACQEQEESKLDGDSSVEDEEPFIDESSDQENQH